MNKDSKKFIKYVKRIIPIHSKDKREFILLLSQRIKEFSDDLERCTYQDIVNEFGTPNEVAGSYIENMESNELIKKLNRKKLFKYFLLTLSVRNILPQRHWKWMPASHRRPLPLFSLPLRYSQGGSVSSPGVPEESSCTGKVPADGNKQYGYRRFLQFQAQADNAHSK